MAPSRIVGLLARRPGPLVTDAVSIVTFCGWPDWLESSRMICPAPTVAGETWIASSWIAPVSVTGGAGRRRFVRSSWPPQPAAKIRTQRTSQRTKPDSSARDECKRHCNVRPRADAVESMLDQPLATAEFVALDTETNGFGGERCELTEVGWVLVGGGELHDEASSLVGVAQPLGRYIQRFTGISQEMVDKAPDPEDVLPQLANDLRNRVLVAHNARFDVRVLRQAFARAALEWPDPPVMCTVQLARRFLPLQPRRGLATLAGALGIEVDEVHRALPDARTCARVFCALFGRLSANAPTIGDALDLLSARRVRTRPPTVPKRPRGERPHLAALPHEPGVYVFRDADGRPLYVGKSVDLRTRARSHFTSGAAWTAQAEHVDHQVTESELGALLLEDRLIKALKPPGNVRGKRDADGYVYIRCRLDIPFPILEVAPEPAAGHAVCVGPVRGRAAAAELVEQLNASSACATAAARSRAASTRAPTARWAAASRPA